MAKEDFCFTYYDGDALRDMSHMNRLERGAYNDVVLQQRKFGRLNLEQIKKILGRDFDEVWPSVNLILMFDETTNLYWIEWLEISIGKMRKHSKRQKENVTKRYQKTTKPLPKTEVVIPLEDGDGYEDEKEDKEKLKEYDLWTTLITDGNDQYFETMLMREKMSLTDQVVFLLLDHRGLLSRYPKMRPPTQQAFRESCMKHIRENKHKQNGTTTKPDIISERKKLFEGT